MPVSSSTLWSRPCTSGGRFTRAAWCTILIAGRSTSAFATPSGWPRPASINGLDKAEVIHRRGPWRSFEAVEFATPTWVDGFNNRRLLEPIGNIPPAEAEERYDAMLRAPDVAA
jgi:transposase InsO family protein